MHLASSDATVYFANNPGTNTSLKRDYNVSEGEYVETWIGVEECHSAEPPEG